MDELHAPDLDEPIWVYRVGADFSVAARDMPEARALAARALGGQTSDGGAFLTRDVEQIEEGMLWGVLDWQQVPARPSQAALVQEQYPGLVADLAVVEGLGTLLRSHAALPEQTHARIREILEGLDRFVFAEDPGRPGGPRIFEGAASTAAEELNEGVYRAFDYNDREYALIVAPSELAASGRVSAAIPKERNDARALDEISRLLEQHTRRQPLHELVRQLNKQVEITRRAGFPSWVPLEGEPERPPRPPARVPVGVIMWSDFDDMEPTVVADTSSVRLARTIATMLHETLLDSDAYAGATEFLASHTGPEQWERPEDVDRWLAALREATPHPAFWIQTVDVGTPTPARETDRTALSDALEQRAQNLDSAAEPGTRPAPPAQRRPVGPT